MIPDNPHIQGAFFKAIGYLDEDKKIAVSVSGGSDSDIIVDFVNQCGYGDKCEYVFFDTGLEYSATYEHLAYLENRYNIQIQRIKAHRSIPNCCKTYGAPFLNKFVSENIERLQKHGFTFEDRPYNELIQDYPNCKSSIQWWDNRHKVNQFCIKYKKLLKEFLIENPPKFRISSKCCTYAKKATAHQYNRTAKPDIIIMGLRQAEGGIRATAYNSCYSDNDKGPDTYRPIWWFTDQDKRDYNRFYKIKNSRAYTQYNFKRTGCACCPFGLSLEYELNQVQRYEPKLYKAVNRVFGPSIEYTRKYYQFRADREHETARLEMKTQPLTIWGLTV